LKKHLQNILTVFLSILLCFSISELYFRFFYIESDSLGFTLSHQKWVKKYWKPLNSNGLRDREWTQKDLTNKKVIAVIGDSFVAGHGIKNASDRFPDILATKLGNKYAIVNLSFPGWGTKTELFVLKNYPLKPDIVIWSYFPNDIKDAAKENKIFPPDEVKIPGGITGKAISASYFLNFIYWNIFRITNLNNDYFMWIQNQFNDSKVWNTHKRELETVCELTKNKNTKLIVVLFPFLTKEANSNIITEKVENVFLLNNVPVLDASKLIPKLMESELTVSKIDAHPSIKLHKLVGDELYKIVLSSKLR